MLLRWLLVPLAFVWTSNKLLVLDNLLVNSVKLNLFVLVLDWRGVLSSSIFPEPGIVLMLADAGRYCVL
jgi:hypothetical protein